MSNGSVMARIKKKYEVKTFMDRGLITGSLDWNPGKNAEMEAQTYAIRNILKKVRLLKGNK